MPKISVIVPTYNRAHYLSQAIESVLQQTFDDFELIIVDDGSTDSTGEVVASFQDRRIIYDRQPRNERGATRNRGVALSQAPYLTFLDDDDWYLPHKLEAQVRTLDERDDIGMVIGGWDRVDDAGRLVRAERPWLHHPQPALRDWLFAAMAHVAAVAVRRHWFQQVGGFDSELAPAEDTDLWFRLALAGCPTAWTKQPVFKQRMHRHNSVRNMAHAKHGKLAMLDKIFSDSNVQAAIGITKANAYAKVYMGFACLGYAFEDVEAAKADLARATNLDPSLLANDADRLLEIVAAYAWNHLTGDPTEYTRRVFMNLPDHLATLQPLARKALARTWTVGAFRAYQYQELGEARRAALRALTIAPSVLLNRGLVSILVQSVTAGSGLRRARASEF
ncbi:MAG: glycosyltransferase family 2 protein [Candidatus Promineifilaceae bacterium]